MTDMVTLTIDDKTISVPKGTTVYHAAKQLGIEIPIFCYHEKMPPFGACRMCLVEVEKFPKLQASCTLEATDGMRVQTTTSKAVKGREEILEFLLINHPLDCPICDRAGECPLQDQTVKYGPGLSRFFEEKRRFPKPLPLNPVLMLDRERCIVCARCTRFGDIVAGDHALQFIDRGFRTEVGTPDGQPAESKFIGNTIKICPVGALTSRVYRFRARPWDNHPTETTCTLCPVGCSKYLDSRDGEILRTRSCENRDVNDIWLCDKGWFGYEFSSHPDRLMKPLIRKNGTLVEAEWEEALSLIATTLHESAHSGKMAAFGGNPLTVEENYLFQKLFRSLNINNVDHRIGMPLFDVDDEGMAPGMESSIGELENMSFVILLGLDITEEFPVMWLRIKQAINKGATVIFIGNYAPEIAKHLTKTILHAPGKELETLKHYEIDINSLAAKGKGAVLLGRQYLATAQRQNILSELLRWKKASPNLAIDLVEGLENSHGARFAGMHPQLGPEGVRVDNPGLDVLQVLDNASRIGWDLLYVAGADPASHIPSKLWKEARANTAFLIVQDLFLTKTAQEADVVLPTLSYVEKSGTFINVEGRVQKIRPGKEIPTHLYSDAEIFILLGKKLKMSLRVEEEFASKLHDKIARETPERLDYVEEPQNGQSEGMRAVFSKVLFDHGVRMVRATHLVQMAPSPKIRLNPADAHIKGLKNGDCVEVKTHGISIAGEIECDKGVAEKVVVLPLGFAELPAHHLDAKLLNGFVVEIVKKTNGCMHA